MAKKSNFLQTTRNVVRTRFTKKLERVAQQAFTEAKKSFEEDFNKHQITQELSSHVSPSPILKANGWNRRGSLFGFMGFHAGSDPIAHLRTILDNDEIGFRFKLNKNIFKRALGILGEIRSPSPEDLEAGGAKFEGWGDGRSWPQVLEDEGIENLAFFLGDKEIYGRSQEGTQVEAELNPGKHLSKMDYLGKMFKRVEKRFIKLLEEGARKR